MSTKKRSSSVKASGSNARTSASDISGADIANLALGVAAGLLRASITKKPAAVAAAAAAESAARARRVIYVHGIGNKPTASILKCQWDTALYGFDLGDRSRMAYWVNRERYPTPEAGNCGTGDLTEGDEGLSPSQVKAFGIEDAAWLDEQIEEIADTPAERAWLSQLASKMSADAQATDAQIGAKALPLPAFIRRAITRRLTKTFLKDVHDLFYDEGRREVMVRSVLDRISSGGGPFVVIGHSQGSMVAYLALSRLQAGGVEVPLFVTIGSPLGITEVQDQLKNLLQVSKLRAPPIVGRWVNVADRLDPISLDVRLASDYSTAKGVKLEDFRVSNPDGPRHAHSGTGYLRTEPVRRAVREAVDAALFQPITDFVIARDVVRQLEDGAPQERHEVLIELSTTKHTSIEEARSSVRQAIDNLRARQQSADDDYQVEELERFVSVRLTRNEAEVLAATLGGSPGQGIWRTWKNAKRVALLETSINTLQVRPAHNAYRAHGKAVEWAVLDSGIYDKHPHFLDEKGKPRTIAATYDCTVSGKLKPGPAPDIHGHGTHVAGIIAGKLEIDGRAVTGMAPETRLHIYKVLDDSGDGKDSWIIKALDHIARVNEEAGNLKIHGVNLSLGGPFDASAYACGHSPLCRELRRLWRQGVVVVIAAGNEGYVTLQSEQGEMQASLQLTIGDPANLEEAITVGSVHKSRPHTYGGSYFSSRGPTADGRQKPDVVAPGERILSCRHQAEGKGKRIEDLYTEMSGTSMAAPHVSGLIAAFLSIHQEFIGYPDKVKTKLLQTCTDLGRERTQQGAGMPNLIRMLGAS